MPFSNLLLHKFVGGNHVSHVHIFTSINNCMFSNHDLCFHVSKKVCTLPVFFCDYVTYLYFSVNMTAYLYFSVTMTEHLYISVTMTAQLFFCDYDSIPVFFCDNDSTRPCWFFVSILELCVDPGLPGFVLHDFPKLIFVDATKKCCGIGNSRQPLQSR